MPEEIVRGEPENQPAKGTGSESAPAAKGSEQQPASAKSSSESGKQERPFFDDKLHVPRSRLTEVTTKGQERERQLLAELETEKRRVLALTGVTPKSNEDKELEAARAVLEKWYPGLAKLSDADFVKKLEGTINASEQLEANTDQYWKNQGARAFRELEDFAKKELGGELSARGTRALRAAFIDYIQTDEEAGAAYVEQDPDVVKRFWEDYRKTFIEPVRRTSNASLIERSSRLRMPRGGGSAAPNAPAPKKVNFANEEEVHSGAWDAIKARLQAARE